MTRRGMKLDDPEQEKLLKDRRLCEMEVSVLRYGIAGAMKCEYISAEEFQLLQSSMESLAEAIARRDAAADRYYSSRPARRRRSVLKPIVKKKAKS